MGMSATQARYLNLIAQQSDLEFQGQQINESRTTLSEQTNNLYSQLQDLNVPTPPHTTDYTTIQYSGSLGADNFTLGKIVPSGSTYTVNLNYNKAGNSTYSAGKAEVKSTPETIWVNELDSSQTTSQTAIVATTDGQIGANSSGTEVNGKEILHKVADKSELSSGENASADVYVMENGKFIKKDRAQITDEDFANGVYTKITAKYEEIPSEDGQGTTVNKNYTAGVDYYYHGENTETIVPSLSSYDQISSYYVSDGDGIRHATTSDFNYNSQTKVYEFKEDLTYFKASSEGNGIEKNNPDYSEGIGQSLNGNPLMEANSGLDKYLTQEQKVSAIEALRNGFPEYTNLSDDDLLNNFYVSFSTEGSLKVPHFTLKQELKNPVNGSQTQWAEYYDITSTGTYTKTTTYENCELTFDTSGRITQISLPVTGENGEIVYHTVELTATSVTDEAAYKNAYNDYEYEKYEYDREQMKINAQMSIIQQEDKKLELKLQRLDNERTQITTEIEALDKVINDNIEASYKTFSG